MSEREQFEAWAMQFNPQLLINFGRGPTVRGQIAWEAWQAARAQPAQAGQVLTDDALWELWNAQGCDDMNQSEAMKFARAIEQAVLAKRVPMALDQIKPHFEEYMVDDELDFVAGVRFAERHHGIVGEKGGA